MKVFVAGDFCPRGRLAPIIEKVDYAYVFSDVRGITEGADLSIVNLESPVATKGQKPIEKCGGHLRCTSNAVKAIKWAGFDCVTLANNHFLDYGEEGVKETIETLKVEDMAYVGGGGNLSEASKILYKEIKCQRLAIINCCEHEFSIATETVAGSNPLDAIKQYYAINEARKHADRVLVIVHGGHEHFQLPSPRMVEVYRFFIDVGADAVVNHHQHCFSGYEIYKSKPIFYGLGNFCFDKASVRSGIWTEGYAVTINFTEEEPEFSIHPYRQCADEPRVVMLDPSMYDERLSNLNAIIATPQRLKEEVNAYYAKSSSTFSNIFEPLFNRFYHAAKAHGLLPSFIGKKRKLAAADFINCEAHRDKLIYFLMNR